MFIVNILSLSVPILLISFLYYKFPPKSSNAFYGYRTGRSMSSEKMWVEGNKYASKLMLKLSLIQFILSIILIIISISSKAFYGVGFWIATIFLMINLFILIVKTERHLKGLEEGEQKAQNM